ncbi:MAG: hypothetical protein LBP80_10525 [Treponema sp.]|nr:hypothetical protein [Treponema sp.]
MTKKVKRSQGDSTYFLIVKISLNSPEFPGKTNHNEPKVLCGSKFFNVLINFSLWKVSAVALKLWASIRIESSAILSLSPIIVDEVPYLKLAFQVIPFPPFLHRPPQIR